MAIPALYWSSVELGSNTNISDGVIWDLIKSKMQEIGLLGVQKNPSDVNGHTRNTIVATTFVKLAQNSYVLVIMAAGDSALTLRDKLYAKLSSATFL